MSKQLKVCVIFNILLLLVVLLTGCGKEVEITNQQGFSICGKGLNENAVLVSKEVDVFTPEGYHISDIIKKVEYDKYSTIRIFSINLLDGEKKIQPTGKVKLTIPVNTELFTNCIVIVLKNDNTTEIVTPTVESKSISFETSELNYFIIASK